MSTCTKKRYSSREQAGRALERIRDWRRRHSTGPQQSERRAYFCDRCKGHHLTKEPFVA